MKQFGSMDPRAQSESKIEYYVKNLIINPTYIAIIHSSKHSIIQCYKELRKQRNLLENQCWVNKNDTIYISKINHNAFNKTLELLDIGCDLANICNNAINENNNKSTNFYGYLKTIIDEYIKFIEMLREDIIV